MTELGLRLKEAREEKGLTLEDLQGTTKIQKRYLAAIEEGNYDVIPGKFYVRAFIKQYSETVGLDTELLFDEYKQDVPSSHSDDVSEKISQMPAKKELPKSASKFMEALPTIFMIIGVIIVAAIVYIFFQGGNQSQSPPEQESPTTETSQYSVTEGSPLTNQNSGQGNENAQPEEAGNETGESDASSAEPPKPQMKITELSRENATTTYELTGVETVQLEVIAKENSWVRIRDGAKKELQSGELSSGKTMTQDISGHTEVDLRLGNAPGIEMKINGETVPYEVKPNDPVTQNIKILIKKEEKSS